MLSRQAKPILRRKGHIYVWTLQGGGVKVTDNAETPKVNVYIACLSEITTPDTGHAVIEILGEDAFLYICLNGSVESNWRHGVAFTISKPSQVASCHPAMLALAYAPWLDTEWKRAYLELQDYFEDLELNADSSS